MFSKPSQYVRPIPNNQFREKLAPLKPLNVLALVSGQIEEVGEERNYLRFEYFHVWSLIPPKEWCQLNLQPFL